MADSDLRRAIIEALTLMNGRDEPSGLLGLAARVSDISLENVRDAHFEALLEVAGPADALIVKLGHLLSRFDAAVSVGDWAAGSLPYTNERRMATCSALGLSDVAARIMASLRPVLHLGQSTVISTPFSRWYSRSRVYDREFYWPQYREYLRRVRGWPDASIDSLDAASDQILERLADPTEITARSQRGLVVGHVQSGKTANYTGVIAKSIDAGYRLIIVLTGIQEPLRRQTQRRLDMELLGRQNILGDLTEFQAVGRDQGEYLDDPSWDEGMFSDFGGEAPSPPVMRLTTRTSDFNKHRAGLLFVNSANEGVPLFNEGRLFATPARIAIVKKNAKVLDHLIHALRANKNSMIEMPALIIDDESDQASVNTSKPSWRTKRDDLEVETFEKDRKRVNELISTMLKLLPRAQYVGYTATPFANVFVDPGDEHDIFPRDFIISLAEPTGYMGASAFFDDQLTEGSGRQLSNKSAYVRELEADSRDEEGQRRELRGALAAFIVTGAIKLYRESVNSSLSRGFRHHTMLVHESSQKAAHRNSAEMVKQVWENAKWLSADGHMLLRDAFEDILPTLRDRAEPGIPIVDNFGQIKDHINEAVRRIECFEDSGARSTSNCVLIVNSDQEFQQRLDFDHRSTWKVVVGGAMLSRGFTIEGLTISYFRRLARAHDTLLQMGRWFGYRPGYSDLIRLYLAKKAKFSNSATVNLYDAFVAIAASERSFREQLSTYAEWIGDRPAITPRELHPLVVQCLTWLKPTANNKMYYARIKRQRQPIFSPKGMAFESNLVRQNWNVSLPLVSSANKKIDLRLSGDLSNQVTFWVGTISVAELTEALESIEWLDDFYDATVRPNVEYYRFSQSKGLLEDFLILFPQLSRGEKSGKSIEVPGVGVRSTVLRMRHAFDYYEEFTDPRHRDLALNFLSVTNPSPPELDAYLKEGSRGVILAYIIPERGPSGDQRRTDEMIPRSPSDCTLGLTIYLPKWAAKQDKGEDLVFEAVEGAEAYPN